MTQVNESADRIIRSLKHHFQEAIEALRMSRKMGSQKDYEVDFCYAIDGIERDAACNQQRYISEAKKIIDEVYREANGS